MNQCRWCQDKYANGRPNNFGSDPKCAFDNDGLFQPNNWNCAGLDQLREDAHKVEVWNEDQHAVLLRYGSEGDFIVLSYYKHRGRTEGAWVVEKINIRPLEGSDVALYLLAGQPLGKVNVSET